jgi:type I restriction enzyme M protein
MATKLLRPIVANPPFSAEWSANPLFSSDDRFSQYGRLINAVTPNDVKQIAGRYLDGHNLIKLILLPEHVISNNNY